MCMKSKQPAAPINTPTYAPEDAATSAFDISMKDGDGKVTDIDGRTTKQNRAASGHKE